MKFTKKELSGIIKICDAVSKVKDSVASELWSKMKSAYPEALLHKIRTQGPHQTIFFVFKEKPGKQVLRILQSMGFAIQSDGADSYLAKKGNVQIMIDITPFKDKYLIDIGIKEI